MLGKIKEFFNKNGALSTAVRGDDAERRIRIATSALLIEMAQTDNEYTEEERERIVLILKKEFSLTEAMCHELVELAKLELSASVDLWQFTALINENYSPAEKIRLMELVWRVVYADGRLDKHEDALVKKLATLLNLRHSEMIDAKLKVLGRPHPGGESEP